MPLFFLAPLVIGVWLAVKCLTGRMPWPWRLALAALCILFSQSFNIQRHFLGSLAGPDAPFWLLALLIWGFAALAIVFIASAVWDIASLAVRGLRRLLRRPAPAPSGATGGDAVPSPSRRLFLKACAGGGMRLIVPAAGVASAAGVHAAVAAPVLRSWDVHLPTLPEAFDGLKLVHMADLHVGPLWDLERAEHIVDMVNGCGADMVLLSGDLADGEPHWRCAGSVPRSDVARRFAGMRSRLGTWACTGNHEYFSNYPAWMRLWEDVGIRFLHNECAVVEKRGGAELVLGGLNDPSGGKRPAGADAFADAPGTGPAFRILLDHRPSAARANARRGAHLQLSGHTHGGQCPLLDRVVAGANGGFVRDWYDVRGMAMYVTSGASQWSGFAVRLGIPCEVALITLHPSRGGGISTRLVS